MLGEFSGKDQGPIPANAPAPRKPDKPESRELLRAPPKQPSPGEILGGYLDRSRLISARLAN